MSELVKKPIYTILNDEDAAAQAEWLRSGCLPIDYLQKCMQHSWSNGRTAEEIVKQSLETLDEPPLASKWTKKDVKALCSTIDSWWLVNRPLDYRGVEEAAAKAREMLANPSSRREIVLAGIRGARARASERYSKNCETIGNQLVRFTEYGKPDELIERFTKLAREEDAENTTLEKMLHRVLAEGLPPEVLAHDPTVGK